MDYAYRDMKLPRLGATKANWLINWLSTQQRFAYWEPKIGNIWQTETEATPVTQSDQSVGSIRGTYYSPSTMTQATALSRPMYTNNSLVFDGGDYLEAAGGLLNIASATNAITFAARIKFSSLAAQYICTINTGSDIRRIAFRITATGSLMLTHRRLDTDSMTSHTSATGLLVANTWYSLMYSVDYTAGTAQAYINNGSDVLAASIPSTGITANTTSLRIRLGADNQVVPANFFSGTLGKSFLVNTIPNVTDRTRIFAELSK